MSDMHKRFFVVTAAGAAGYFALDKVYRYARQRWGPQDSDAKDWVCPGVGAAGAVVAASMAGFVLCRKECPAGTECPVMSSLQTERYVDKLDLPGFTMSTN